jgi:hypothetical protein
MPLRELTDEEVFRPKAGPRELSDADVFAPKAKQAYQPTILPARRGENGLEFVTPQFAKDMWGGVEAPGKVLKGEITPTMENLQGAARQTTGAITTGGIAIPRAVVPAGSMAMNAIGPPMKAAGRAVAKATEAVVQPFTDPDGALGRMLAKRLQQQNPGMGLDEAVAVSKARLQELGPEAVMADLGENTRNLARNMTQGPGETAQRAKVLHETRQGGEKTRQIQNVRENISADDFYEADEAAKAAKAQAGPYYETAYDNQPNVTSKGLRLLLDQEPLIKQGINKGIELMRIEASTARKVFEPQKYGVVMGVDDAGNAIVKDMDPATPLRLWHAAREGLDAMIDAYPKTPGGKPMLDKRGRRIQELRRSLSDELKELSGGPNGQFSQGDAIFASASKLQESLMRGRAFARGDEEVTEKIFKGLNPEQQKAYLSGVGQEMVAMIRRDNSDFTPRQIMAAIKKESATGGKLRAILPNQQQFDNFVKNIERDLTFRDTHKGTRGVSQTASIAQEEGEIAGDTLATMGAGAVDVLRGRSEQAFGRAMGWALGQLRRVQMPQEARDRLGKLLLSQEQADKEEAFRLIQAYQSRGAERPAGR